MTTNPIHAVPAAQNEPAVKTAARPNRAPQPLALPAGKVTLSSQVHQTASTAQVREGGKK